MRYDIINNIRYKPNQKQTSSTIVKRSVSTCTWKDSNPRRAAPEAAALSPELQMHVFSKDYISIAQNEKICKCF